MPSFRAPVPQSKMRRVPSAAVASMHGVLPPKRMVSGPAAAIEPRVPQNLRRMSATCRREDGQLRGEVAHDLGGAVVQAQNDERPAAVERLVEHRREGYDDIRPAVEELCDLIGLQS